ncbi:MAG TPA: hypothetical protein VGF75_08210 [Candidatus Saccharimonadales bacterium]|jgi:hypothetical protein
MSIKNIREEFQMREPTLIRESLYIKYDTFSPRVIIYCASGTESYNSLVLSPKDALILKDYLVNLAPFLSEPIFVE